MARNFTWAAVIAAALLVGPSAMAADPPAPSPPAAAPAADSKPAEKLSRVLGRVSTVDTAGKKVTLASFFGGEDETFTYNDDTKYMMDIPAAASDIKVGDTLNAFVFGGGDDPATTTITPNFLSIVPPVDVPGPPFEGQFKPTTGVVATLKPLTITTGDKKTITITIGDETRLIKSKDAVASDVKPEMFGSAFLKGEGANRVATEIHVSQPPGD